MIEKKNSEPFLSNDEIFHFRKTCQPKFSVSGGKGKMLYRDIILKGLLILILTLQKEGHGMGQVKVPVMAPSKRNNRKVQYLKAERKIEIHIAYLLTMLTL